MAIPPPSSDLSAEDETGIATMLVESPHRDSRQYLTGNASRSQQIQYTAIHLRPCVQEFAKSPKSALPVPPTQTERFELAPAMRLLKHTSSSDNNNGAPGG